VTQWIFENNAYFFMLGSATILFTGWAFSQISKAFITPKATGYLNGGMLLGPAITNLILPNFEGVLNCIIIGSLTHT
jgi:hypothetical protein